MYPVVVLAGLIACQALTQVAALQPKVTQLEDTSKAVGERIQRLEPLVQQLQVFFHTINTAYLQ